ncbi:MAG TPA: CPBP family intramembrane glutamic endopeptidase [Stellaceae bacterium]|nr:CPBP family intramembrane glutamic endopeptidase [Stellaceae bacterium]
MSEERESADLFRLAPTWKGRVRAFLRFLAFVALFSVFTIVLLLILGWLLMPGWPHDAMADLGRLLPLQVAAEVVGALGATALMARAGGRRLADFGFGGRHRWRNFLIGLAGGLGLLALLLLAIRLGSATAIEPAAGALSAAALDALLYALMMLGIGYAEESFSRGYALAALSQSLSFWPAAIATGLVFGLMHAANGGETPMGLASAALFGIVLAYSYRRTGSLWFAVGLHAGWDYAESFVFGVPNSGITLPGSLLQARFDGPAWLTGGSAGPEGSVLILPVFAAMVLIIRQLSPPPGETPSLAAWAAPTRPR